MTAFNRQTAAAVLAAVNLLCAGSLVAMPCSCSEDADAPVAAGANSDDSGDLKTAKGSNFDQLIVESFQRTRGERKHVSWLGVGVAEASEDLASQLGLKQGQGLVVTMVVNNSPAEKAEIRKHDVLAEFDGQLLVDSEQLRKLVQMHSEGDTVNLVVYRGGKKQTVTARLGHTALEEMSMDDDNEVVRGVKLSLARLDKIGPQVDAEMRKAAKALDDEKTQLNSIEREMTEKNRVQIERAVEQARRALERAVRDHQLSTGDFDAASKDMDEVAKNGVDVDKDATVVVQKDLKSSKSIVQSDDTGDYTIVADPKRRLTARDTNGKLLFDGEIETSEQQSKVPRAVWEKVKPILEQLGTIKPSPASNLDAPKDR